MRAAVREELDHLDLLARLDGCGFLRRTYFLPSSARRSARRARQRRQRDEKRRERRAARRIRACSGCIRRVSMLSLTLLGRLRSTRVGPPRADASSAATDGSELDDGDVEAAPGELALDAVQLVGIVVGTEPHAIARRPCRAAFPAASRLPARRARAAPSGSRRRPRCANEPACSQKRSAASRRACRRSPTLSGALVDACAARLVGASRASPSRGPRRALRRLALGWTFGSSTPGRIL